MRVDANPSRAQALALIPQALSAAGRAANNPTRASVRAAMIAVQAVRDTIVPRTALEQRARVVLGRAVYMLEQYEHGLTGLSGRLRYVRQQGVGTVMPPPLFPMPGGYRGPVRSITGPATGPAVPWLPAGDGGGLAVRRYNIMFQVIPMLHEVQRLLRAARDGLGAMPGTSETGAVQTTAERAGAPTLPAPSPSLLDHVVRIEKSLPAQHPIRLQLVQARADTLTYEKQQARANRLRSTPGAELPLGRRLLRAVYKASLIYAGLRLMEMRPRKALVVAAGLGTAVEWVGVEETIKAGALTAARTFTDF